MTSRILLALALVLAGCSTFDATELAQIRQRGLRPELLEKLEHRRVLDPGDLIVLKRAGVADHLVARQLDDVGVNYIASRSDINRLRQARVGPRVIDALLRTSEKFAMREAYRPYDDGWFYTDPWAARFYGDWTLGFGYSCYGGHGGHHHH